MSTDTTTTTTNPTTKPAAFEPPRTVRDLCALSSKLGGHFFSRNTMRFFGTKLNNSERIAYPPQPFVADDAEYAHGYFTTDDTNAPDGVGAHALWSFTYFRDAGEKPRVDFDLVGRHRTRSAVLAAKRAIVKAAH